MQKAKCKETHPKIEVSSPQPLRDREPPCCLDWSRLMLMLVSNVKTLFLSVTLFLLPLFLAVPYAKPPLRLFSYIFISFLMTTLYSKCHAYTMIFSVCMFYCIVCVKHKTTDFFFYYHNYFYFTFPGLFEYSNARLTVFCVTWMRSWTVISPNVEKQNIFSYFKLCSYTVVVVLMFSNHLHCLWYLFFHCLTWYDMIYYFASFVKANT